MTEHPDHPQEREAPGPRRSDDPFGLEAYLEHQRAEFADGPTMAEILEDMDRYRDRGIPGHLIVASVREDRENAG